MTNFRPIVAIWTISCSFLACEKQNAGSQIAEEESTPSLQEVQEVEKSGINLSAGNDAHDHAISAGILNGRADFLPQPEFPARARARKLSGTVSVQVSVDKSGNVVWAAAFKGHAIFRKSAESAARRAKFEPMIIRDRAVRFLGVLQYSFELQ